MTGTDGCLGAGVSSGSWLVESDGLWSFGPVVERPGHGPPRRALTAGTRPTHDAGCRGYPEDPFGRGHRGAERVGDLLGSRTAKSTGSLDPRGTRNSPSTF